ncbi:unnamed protein product [Notodromas monacha]|uniref:Lipoyl-binding domain-containing protein n=1 Tax=Notodromas monacha TaxID=399045 RepID=A0A7R9BF06_9CRUS|nr:unnamed protein product [Notodromas monacha]CAG0913283.1 unnamed protein product [Notodromas monacha]
MKGVSDEGASGLHSPMPGVVNRVEVVPGDQVVKGQTLVVMIAMKMEYVIKAPSAGLVEKVFHKAGDNVARGTELVRLKTDQSREKKLYYVVDASLPLSKLVLMTYFELCRYFLAVCLLSRAAAMELGNR